MICQIKHPRVAKIKGVAKAIELMIVDALVSAEPAMNIARRLENPKKYLYLTDRIQTEIEASEDPVRDTSWKDLPSLTSVCDDDRNSRKRRRFCIAFAHVTCTNPSTSKSSLGTRRQN